MKNNKIGVIIQARMGSLRFPGKVLKKIYNNLTVLDLLIERIKLSKLTQEIIIATSHNKENIPIVKLAKNQGVNYFIGSEKNVLRRYYKAAKKFKINTVIRITSDCPFIDPKMLDEIIKFYHNHNYDFIYNVIEDLTNIPIGFDIEIFSFKILKKVYKLAKNDKDKEHVTSYINYHPNEFSIFYYNDKKLKKIDGLRLTIDYPEDLKLCRAVFKKLLEIGKSYDFTIYDIYDVLEKEPHIMDINKHIPNKPLLF